MKNSKLYRPFLLLFMVLPVLVFSQMRITNNISLTLKDQTSIKVTGDVELQSGSKVSIFGDFNISGHLVNLGSADDFILKSNATNTGSLIVEGSVNGDYTVERYLSSSTWHFLSASVDQLTTSSFYFNDNPLTWMSYFDEPNNQWDYLEGINDNMPLGNGYKFWLGETSKSAIVAAMKGELISNDISVTLCTDQSSWNLIGNPFSSSINWDHGNWGENTTGSVYVWDSTYNNGDYRVWNGVTGDLTDGNIPISQSFFVYANSAGPFTIPAAARTHEGDDFYKSEQKSPNLYIKLQLKHKTFGNTLFIGFPKNGSPNFDNKGDAYKLYSNDEHSQIYAMEENEKLCINANAPLQEESRTIPIYIDQWEEGSYTLSLYDMENLPNTEVLLEDQVKRVLHNFNQQSTFYFQAHKNDPIDRFVLHFNREANQLSEMNGQDPLLSIYNYRNRIYIKSKEDCEFESGSIVIYNQLGQLSYESYIEAGAIIEIQAPLPSGNYIIKVIKKSFELSTKLSLQ